MGKRGGSYPGAGRPKGSIAKRTQELLQKAQEGGIMPMDVLLNDMRYFHNLAEQLVKKIKNKEIDEETAEDLKKAIGFKQIARECARDVSPYIHPKLASVEANVNVTNVEAELAELE